MDSKPFLTPSPLPSPAATIPNPLSPSSSKRVTISEPNSNTSSDSFTFNPQTRTTSRSRSKRTQPVRVASARSDSARGSQREIPDEEARFIYINQPNPSPKPPSFKPNKIRTSKYTLLTFLPRNLFEQFHRIAYIYFLILIALNQIPQLGVFTPAASILPLAFVLTVTAAKDGFEDWRRHRSDLTENNRSSFVLSGTDFHPVPWKSIRVGDIIRVGSNETLPSDMVILSTSDASGVAYVQTINLDGESNLKSRYAKQETQNIPPDRLQCVIRCEQPNRNIYGFNGRIDLGTKRVPIGPGNVILRGCEIKNTEWVIGVVVYTGMETKVMLNSTGAPTKKSRLETNMNRETIYLAVALFILCSAVTILGGLWLDRHEKELDYLPYYRKMDYEDKKGGKYKYYGIGWEVVFTFLMGVIQFQVMIPIALFISMEIVRVGQAYFMIQDEGMYHEESDSRFQCRALNINEDLGQIKYVFSDKTGTLTDNKMEFRCASVGGVDYGSGMEGGDGTSVTVDGQTWRPKTRVEPDPELLHLLSQNNSKEANRAKDFILALAACNTIVPIVVDTPDPSLKLIDYQGESPDEQALVYAAAAYGFLLVERTSGHIVIDVLGQRERYAIISYALYSACLVR